MFRKLAVTGLSVLAISTVAGPLCAQGFGSAVAVGADEVLIGESGGQTAAGGVWVYRRDGSGWQEASRVVPGDSEDGDRFGRVLAVDGSRLFVTSSAAAYVFERSGQSWSEAARIPLSPEFGGGVLLAGDLAFLASGGGGGFRRPGGAPPAPGSVMVLGRRGDGTWAEVGRLSHEGGTAGDGFGASLAMVGDRLAVGAPGARAGGTAGAGSVYLFERGADGAWTEVGDALTAAIPSTRGGFGAALLALRGADGPSVFVAASGVGGVGGVYEFLPTGDGGLQAGTAFLPPTAGPPGRGGFGTFGTSLASVDGELWIGGVVDGDREGRIYRYTRDADGGWSLAGMLAGTELDRNSSFGSRLAVGDGVVAVAATGKDYGWGTVYMFERAGSGWSQTDEVWSDPTGYAAVTGGEVACEDGEASAFGCNEVDITSFMPLSALGAGRGVRVNDVWGWTDPQTGREYALVGMTDQASFIDITDAENPRLVGRLPMPETARGSTWRDIKVYRDHAYIVSDGAGDHGMQVFDLTRLRDVGSEPVTFTVDALYDEIASAHNIVINEGSGFAYSVGSSGGGETCGGALHMIDIRDPKHPTFAGCFQDTSTGRSNTGYSHDAQCIDYHGPDMEHAGREICFGSNETALSIADVTDKANPIALSAAAYPNVGYAHQGWVTDDHRYFFMDDELDEIQQAGGDNPFPGTRTMIWDISDLDDPVLVKEHFGESTASDHNLYVVGDLMYQSNYNSGLRILNISDPENPREVGFIDTVPYAEGPSMGGSWSNYPYFASGTIIVTSGNEGLFMVRYRKPALVP